MLNFLNKFTRPRGGETMKNAKKSISLAMVAIFTTFVMLSGIPVSAASKSALAKKQISVATTYVVKSEKIVKVSTFVVKTAQLSVYAAKAQVKKVTSYGKTYAASYNALTKRLANVQLKINARAKQLAVKPVDVKTAAEKAVAKAETLTNTDTYDLVGNATDLANAQDAITASLDAVTKLNKDSADYKGLMARVDAANEKIINAMDEIDANNAAIEEVKAQEAAVTAAETAVVAVEAAPLATAADLKAALDLGKTAATAVAVVKDADKVAAFNARLKVVADKGIALQAKLDEALVPAKVVTVSAVDGTITVTFDKVPTTTMAAADFVVTQTVTTTSAVTTTVAATSLTTNGAVVVLTVPAIASVTTDQSVVYSVAYTTGSAVSAVAYNVAKIPTVAVKSVTATNYKTMAIQFNKAVNPATVTAANVKVYNAGVLYTVDAAATTSAVLGGEVGYIMSADNTTLYVEFGTAVLPSASINVTIDGVANATAATETLTGYSNTVVVTDTTLPTFVSATVKNAKSLVLTFSEPISNGLFVANQVLPNLTIDGASIIGTETPNFTTNTVTVALATALSAGSHTLKVTGLTDYANYIVADNTSSVVVVADTLTPAIVSAKVIDRNTIDVTFNKDLDPAKLGTFTVGSDPITAPHTVVGSAANVVELTLATPLTIGAVVETSIAYVNSTDAIGNTVATSTTYKFATADDTTLPTATCSLDSVTNKNTVTLTFSKPMQMNIGAITLTDALGNKTVVAIPAAVTVAPVTGWDSTHKILTLNAAQLGLATVVAGTYTFDITGMLDNSIRQNAMLEMKPVVLAVNTSVPTISNNAYTIANDALDTALVTLYFSEPMDPTTLKTIGNYTVNISGAGAFVPLLAIANGGVVGAVSSVAADNKSVVLAIPQATAATTVINVYGLKDSTGNAMTVLAGNNIVAANVATIALSAIAADINATSKTTVKVLFNSPLASVDPSSFNLINVSDGSPAFTFNNAQFDTTDATHQTVIYTVNGTMASDVPYKFTTSAIAANLSLTKNIYGSAATAVTIPATQVTDKVAPTVTAAADAVSGIDLTFSELVKATVGTSTLDIVVRDNTGAIVANTPAFSIGAGAGVEATGYNTVTLTGLTAGSTYTVQVLSRNITDVSAGLNKVTELAATTVVAK